jgi:hypothetical protein
MVALLLAPITQGGADDAGTAGVGAAALRAFGIDPDAAAADPDGTERVVRVVGALAALAVLSLAANQHALTTAWRPFVLATCSDALGHRRAGASPTDSLEA